MSNDYGHDSAFPSVVPDDGVSYVDEGIDIRDYFAGKALIGITTQPIVVLSPKEYAEKAYRIADAMVEQRKKKGGT